MMNLSSVQGLFYNKVLISYTNIDLLLIHR